MDETARTLSKIEIRALNALKSGKALEEKKLAEKAGIPIDSARRAIAWLNEKKLVDVSEIEEKKFELSERGKNALRKGLPEEILIKAMQKRTEPAGIRELQKESMLEGNEFNAALGKAKRYNLITMNENKEFMLTGAEEIFLEKSAEREILKAVEKGKSVEGRAEFKELRKRGLIEEKKQKQVIAKINPKGLKALEKASETNREYNLAVEVKELEIGKKHAYLRFLDEVKEKLISMGFKEMNAPLIVQEFYNFDVLFQPQGHAARDWTGTFILKNPREGMLSCKKAVKAVKEAHESGGRTGSKGWQYKWSEKKARQLMPAAHGTAHSARQLVKGIEVPGKYFSIARCFRPDTVDKTHLMEFNQLEGIIAGELSFMHLLGVLKEFAEEIAGAEKVRFFPDYYPFTEPSVQLSAKHKELGWIEFGGAGLFRPEVIRPLGIECNVLAWGLGIDRLAMFKLGIDDMRELFSRDLNWLKKQKITRL